jgi:hypothetical protein
MAGFQQGQANWEAAMQFADANYQAAKPTMVQEWAAGLSAAGQAPGPRTRANYERKIAAATLQNVQGKGAKWLRKTLAGIAR